MAECCTVTNLKELALHLGVTEQSVEFSYVVYDERNGWGTYLVSVNGEAVGFTNGLIF